jgi:hypothetical protein
MAWPFLPLWRGLTRRLLTAPTDNATAWGGAAVRQPRRAAAGLAGGLLLLVLAGCAGYRLGPTSGLAPGAKSIQVSLFQNRTLEPRLAEAVAQALRKRLQQDGTFKLATRGEGDILVSGVITRYARLPVSFQPRDVITARDFDLALYVQVTAEERATGKKLLDREVRGRTTVRVAADLPSVERQALPLLAEDLARNVTALLVEGTW